MPARKAASKTSERKARGSRGGIAPLRDRVRGTLDSLRRLATKHDRENLKRFNISAAKAFGVSMSNIQRVAKPLGKDHDLAGALWETGWYEARMACSFIDETERVTPAQMDRWCRDFDNWGICDTLCFNLFDRTPHAWKKVAAWSGKKEEFVKRAAFALLWGLTVHDKESGNASFLKGLALIERAATDDRHLVYKAVNMALRAIGKRNSALNAAAVKTARRLADREKSSARWVGRNALGELTSPAVMKRIRG